MLGLTKDDFIKKAIFVHGNQYTYDKYKLDEILAREVLTWVQE